MVDVIVVLVEFTRINITRRRILCNKDENKGNKRNWKQQTEWLKLKTTNRMVEGCSRLKGLMGINGI
jgi:hypothetical protein